MVEFFKLDWKMRINVFDVMEYLYFKVILLFVKLYEIFMFEESYEFDWRKFYDCKVNLLVVLRGGMVGVGFDVNGVMVGFNSGDGFNGCNGMNGLCYCVYDEW